MVSLLGVFMGLQNRLRMHEYHVDRVKEENGEIRGLLTKHRDFVAVGSFFFSFPPEICRSCYTNGSDLHNFWRAAEAAAGLRQAWAGGHRAGPGLPGEAAGMGVQGRGDTAPLHPGDRGGCGSRGGSIDGGAGPGGHSPPCTPGIKGGRQYERGHRVGSELGAQGPGRHGPTCTLGTAPDGLQAGPHEQWGSRRGSGLGSRAGQGAVAWTRHAGLWAIKARPGCMGV